MLSMVNSNDTQLSNANINVDDSFDIFQMREINNGLNAGLDTSWYAFPFFDNFQMSEIRKGLESKIDVSKYASSKYNSFEMKEIRRGLEMGIDLSNLGYNSFQMQVINDAGEVGIDMLQHVSPKVDYFSMKDLFKKLLKEKVMN
jgi:hypothetical protein